MRERGALVGARVLLRIRGARACVSVLGQKRGESNRRISGETLPTHAIRSYICECVAGVSRVSAETALCKGVHARTCCCWCAGKTPPPTFC